MGFLSKLAALFTGGPSPGPRYWETVLQLGEGETIEQSAGGWFLLGSGGNISQGKSYMLVVTNLGRVVVKDMTVENGGIRICHPGGTSVSVRGYLEVATHSRAGRSLTRSSSLVSGNPTHRQPGPTGAQECVQVVDFVPTDGERFAVGVVESQVPALLAWAES